MKRLALITMLALVLMVPTVASAQTYTTTLEFFGGIMYDNQQGVEFPRDSLPSLIGGGTWLDQDPELLDQLNSESPYYLIGALAYDLDVEMPEWSQVYDWTLEADLWVEGTVYGEGSDDFDESFSTEGPVALGSFSLEGLIGESQADVWDFITSIPMDGYDEDIGGYLIDGNWSEGEIYFALEFDPVEEFDIDWDVYAAEMQFGGTVQLVAQGDEQPVVPEPMSMMLFASGLLGLGVVRRKK